VHEALFAELQFTREKQFSMAGHTGGVRRGREREGRGRKREGRVGRGEMEGRGREE
jgi:hypothetical protein